MGWPVDWYQRVLVDTGRSAALWALIGFLATFAITRGVTRRIHSRTVLRRTGSRQRAAAGRLHRRRPRPPPGVGHPPRAGRRDPRAPLRPRAPWRDLLAGLFGAGAALALDEFALWFHLDDVYWGDEGRKSVDAVLIAAVLGIVLLLQATPVGPRPGQGLATGGYVALVLLHLATAAACIGKGKIATALVGVVVPIVATVGALRLAKPTSVWARRGYTEAKLARAANASGTGTGSGTTVSWTSSAGGPTTGPEGRTCRRASSYPSGRMVSGALPGAARNGGPMPGALPRLPTSDRRQPAPARLADRPGPAGPPVPAPGARARAVAGRPGAPARRPRTTPRCWPSAPQEEAGLDIVTDGEIRRESYSNHFATALRGIDLDRPGTVLNRSGQRDPGAAGGRRRSRGAGRSRPTTSGSCARTPTGP